jgi:hypothetical protein
MPNSDPGVTFRELTELSDLVVTGELSLQETGRIVTSTDTGAQRIIMSATAVDRITFYSGATNETAAAFIQSASPAGDPLFYFTGPAGAGDGPISFYLTPREAWITGGNMVGGSLSTFDPNLSILTGTTIPTVGTGANALESGAYSRMGALVQGHFTLRWSSNGTSGNGTYSITLPKRPATTLPLNPSLGSGRLFTSTGNREWIVDIRQNSSRIAIFRMGTSGGLNVTDNYPAIWVNSSNNRITGHLSYLTTET